MYICCDCEKTFEEPVEWSESRGEYMGEPAFEKMAGCPYCFGGFEEIEEEC